MTLLFLPCIIISILFFILNFFAKKDDSIWRMLFHMGFSACYVYLMFSAIITMANCTNKHIVYFLYGGGVLLLASLIAFIVSKIKTGKKS